MSVLDQCASEIIQGNGMYFVATRKILHFASCLQDIARCCRVQNKSLVWSYVTETHYHCFMCVCMYVCLCVYDCAADVLCVT